MNELVFALGLERFKPFVSALLLPPVPLIALALAGSWWMARRRVLGWALLLAACAGLWLSSTAIASRLLRALHPIPPPLAPASLAELRRSAEKLPTAIVVLGGGRDELAPEYGMADLSALSLQRLRYGVWLSRETGIPLGYSGGLGHAWSGSPGATEAEIATRIAQREWRHPLRWAEAQSRDTRENGIFMARLLHQDGIRRVVLVTSDFHEPRALRAFADGAARVGARIELVPAPVGWHSLHGARAGDWLPSAIGFAQTRYVLHEIIGYWLGA